MADWPPKKNAGFTVDFPIYDNDGDLVSAAAGLDSEVSKDEGTFTDCTNEATETATSSGMYSLVLTSTEMNADRVATITKTSTSNAKTAVNVMYTATRQLTDLAFPNTSGRGMDVDASGGLEVGSFQAGAITAAAIASDAITAAKIADGAIDAATFAASAIDATAIATGAITAAKFAAGAIDAAAIATDAIGSNELAASAITEIQSGLSVLTQADIRTAVGLASANLDTQLSTIDDFIDTEIATLVSNVATILAAVDTEVGAIKTKTDQLVFTNTNKVDAAILASADFATAVRQALADAIMTRDSSAWEASAPVKSFGTAVMKAVHRLRDNAGTLEIYRSDGTTVHASQAVTTDSAAEPIDELSGTS